MPSPSQLCCSICGFHPTPAAPRGTQRALIAVVDEFGRSAVCDLHALGLLAQLAASGDVTLFVARPASAVAV